MPRENHPGLFDEQPAPAAPVALPGVVLREVRCRSVLNRTAISDYSLNAYGGCTHGCAYCYARFMQRFQPHEEPWGAYVDVKVNAPEALARQVRRAEPGSVFVSSACDAYQEAERHYRLTRRCCEILLDAGFHVSVLTKSDLVLRDLDLFRGRTVRIGVTITTPDEDVAAAWEPGAAPVARRLEVLRQAKAAGLATSVMLGPLLPGLSDTPDALRRLLGMARDAGADEVWSDILNARPRVWPSVQGLLRRRWPDLLPLYRAVLFDPAEREHYRRQVEARLAEARAHAAGGEPTAASPAARARRRR